MGKSSYQIMWFNGECWVPYPAVSVTRDSMSQVLRAANKMGFWMLCLAVFAVLFAAFAGHWREFMYFWCALLGVCMGVMTVVWQESVRKITGLLPPVIEEKKDDQEA